MSGRIVDLAVLEEDPYTMYVASATGGVWKTTNNGVTFKPVFEKENGLPQKSYRGLVNVAMGKDMLLIVLAQQSYRYKQKYGWKYKGYLFENKGK